MGGGGGKNSSWGIKVSVAHQLGLEISVATVLRGSSESPSSVFIVVYARALKSAVAPVIACFHVSRGI